MTLGTPPKSIGIQREGDVLDQNTTFPRYRFTTEDSVITNPAAVEHDEWAPIRQKAPTPVTPSHSSSDCPVKDDDIEDADLLPRGRSATRTECIVPSRSRQISSKAVQHLANDAQRDTLGNLRLPDGQTFLTSDSTSASSSGCSEDLKPSILEPAPHQVAGSIEERESANQDSAQSNIQSANSPISSAFALSEGIGGFQHHRDTFAVMSHTSPKHHAATHVRIRAVSPPVLSCLNTFIDHNTYLALRLTSRWWHSAITHIRPLIFPAVYRLPVELVQEIYNHLSPIDFNSARHTCRAWMGASLEKALLTKALREGGWWNSLNDEMPSILVRTSTGENDFATIWMMSSILARECALSGYWKGNGLAILESYNTPNRPTISRVQSDGVLEEDQHMSRVRRGNQGHYQLSSVAVRRSFRQLDGTNDDAYPDERSSPFEYVLEVDFCPLVEANDQGRAIATYAQAQGLQPGMHFTASLCGRFILLTDGCKIFVYRLSQGLPHGSSRGDSPVRFADSPNDMPKAAIIYPVTSIVCPHRVLAVSMDTSCGRYAIAALLDDRMGLVCDMLGANASRSCPQCSIEACTDNHQFAPDQAIDRDKSIFPAPSGKRSFAHLMQQANRSGDASPVAPGFQSSSTTRKTYYGYDPPALSPQLFPADSCCYRHVSNSFPIPHETGPRSIYRALCSNDDPPLSVAICPQRKCVAFGCKSGIELHWVDALTGYDLNRWFPFSAPSDFLYFLPPRKYADNAKKLRLASSTGALGMKGRLRERFAPLKPFSLGANTSTGGSHDGWNFHRVNYSLTDCLRSVPLSDGHHVLFTEAKSKRLYLGTDYPNGGGRRMIPKVILAAPRDAFPTTYAVGRELSWGVRVVVGYGDEVWFYSIPKDILNCENDCQDEYWIDQYVDADKAARIREQKSALTEALARDAFLDSYRVAPESIWPVKIQGAYVAKVSGLTELTINSHPASFTIWAFATNGTARAWQIRGGNSREATLTSVQKDGTVVEKDEDLGGNYNHEIFPFLDAGFQYSSNGDPSVGRTLPLQEISYPRYDWTTQTSFDGYISRSGSLNTFLSRARRQSRSRDGCDPPPGTPILHSVNPPKVNWKPSLSPLALQPSLPHSTIIEEEIDIKELDHHNSMSFDACDSIEMLDDHESNSTMPSQDTDAYGIGYDCGLEHDGGDSTESLDIEIVGVTIL